MTTSAEKLMNKRFLNKRKFGKFQSPQSADMLMEFYNGFANEFFDEDATLMLDFQEPGGYGQRFSKFPLVFVFFTRI